MSERKRIAIIGAGHNALVCATYLAKAGHEVHIFESRNVVGGCASNDTTSYACATLSKAAYVNSLMDTKIVRELNLEKYGYEVLPRDPSSFTPLPDGRYLLLGHDMEANQKELSKFKFADAMRYPRYVEALEGPAAWVEEMMALTPPNLPPTSLRDVRNLWHLAKHVGKLRAKDVRILRQLNGDPVAFLDKWFPGKDGDALKATLLTDALIGTTEFSGYVLLHHVMGMAGGTRGVWGYMRGGMGALSESIARSATSYGAKIHLQHKVRHITTNDRGDAIRLVVEDKDDNWHHVPFSIIVSGIDLHGTLGMITARTKRQQRVAVRARSIQYTSATMKVNAVLREKPVFPCWRENNDDHLRGTIHIAPSVEYIKEAMRCLPMGLPSSCPILEITIPSIVDDSVAPQGKHVMSILVQFTPYHHPKGTWDNKTRTAYMEQNIMPTLKKYAPNIEHAIEWFEVLAPPDLERELGLTGGSLFHGDMVKSQLFFNRPIRGMADYRTPFPGLYLCGSGTHPGGGVTGAPGRNAAREILDDLRS